MMKMHEDEIGCADCGADCGHDHSATLCAVCDAPLCGLCAEENEDADIGTMCAGCAEMRFDDV